MRGGDLQGPLASRIRMPRVQLHALLPGYPPWCPEGGPSLFTKMATPRDQGSKGLAYGPQETEPQAGAAAARPVMAAERRPRVPRGGIPATAAIHPGGARAGSRRIH